MIPEPYLGLLVGSILTLIVSIVSIFLTNHFSERHWSKTKSIEQQEQLVEQVYSPLFFCLFEAPYHLGYIAGVLYGIQEDDLLDKALQDRFLEWLRDYAKEQRRSDTIKNILLAKLGMISPTEFRRDIFLYCFFLGKFERKLRTIDENDFKKERIPLLQIKFQNLIKFAKSFNALTSHFVSFLEFLISKKGQLPSDYRYGTVIDDKIKNELRELLSEPINKETKKALDKAREEGFF